MTRKVIITAALTGGADTRSRNPAVPVTPAEIASEAIAACSAGAAIAHIHVRDPTTGKASMCEDLYAEVVGRIRDSGSPVIVNLTTGPGARYIPDEAEPSRGGPGTTLVAPEQRVAHILSLKPEMCTLDVATFNFGAHAFINTPDHLRRMASLIRKACVKPEIEVFDLGHVRLAAALHAEGLFSGTPLFQLCLGVPWGAPAELAALLALRDGLPPGANWAGFALGADQFPYVAAVAAAGGHVRVGLEDNLYLSRGVLAPGNAALVDRAVTLLRAMGYEPATPNEARVLIGLEPR